MPYKEPSFHPFPQKRKKEIPEECTGRERQILDSRFCKLEAIEMSSHSTVTFNRTLISKLGGDSFGEKMIESKQGNKKCNNFVVHTLSGHPRVASVLNIISCKVRGKYNAHAHTHIYIYQGCRAKRCCIHIHFCRLLMIKIQSTSSL